MQSLTRNRAAIIIPAHNESRNIGRLLSSLTAPGWQKHYEIIVSCNACTDNTAEIVKNHTGVQCINSEIPSKIKAINRAEHSGLGYPRIYIDADIDFDHDSVIKLITALQDCNKPALAAATAIINCTNSNFLVKSYYNVWQRSRYCLVDGYGGGVYALNQAARELFIDFPEVISDDGFVRAILPSNAVIRVPDAVAEVNAPYTVSGLLKIKTRSKLGNIQLARSGLVSGAAKSYGEVHLRPSSLFEKLIYSGINTAALISAKAKVKNIKNYQWQRDDSSRGKAPAEQKKKVLAIASKGGHWLQLLRLRNVWEDQDVFFISNDPTLCHYVPGKRFSIVSDASMDSKPRLLLLAIQILWKILLIRPDIVITTGAAPGYFAIVFGKLFGAKTVWIDSIANAEELSLAGRKVARFTDVWLTQWPELAKQEGPHYKGSVF